MTLYRDPELVDRHYLKVRKVTDKLTISRICLLVYAAPWLSARLFFFGIAVLTLQVMNL